MYSYEDRIRAVKLYIKLGKRVAATIHQLGYPTQNALKSWHRTYEQGSGLPRAYVRAKPKYSQAQQTLAIEHCSPDNAACEGFFGRLKTEWFYPGNWQSSMA